MQKTALPKDILLAAIYIGLGLLYGVYTLSDLAIGTALNMGPGYFPLVLSGLLILIGAAVGFQGLSRSETIDFRVLPWRGIFFITLATIVFAVLARGMGILIAAFLTALIASFAARTTTWLSALATAAVLSAFSTVVFIYGMQLPLGVFGTWFR